MSRRLLCLLMFAATILLGLFMRSGLLPGPIAKYGGSALYAVMLYWLIAALWLRGTRVSLGLCAFAAASAVEFFKLVRTPALDAFRLTVAGKLTLGRVFSAWDLLAYAVGIGAAMLFDALLP